MTTKLLYGKAFRAPSISELFVTNNPINLGNKDLKPEAIDTYELAFSHQVSNNFLYTSNIFYYSIKDYISFVPTNGNIQAQNIGQRHGQGIELELDYSAIDNLRLLANYSYQNAVDDTLNQDVADVPQHEFYARAEWRFAKTWQLNSQVTWVGSQKRDSSDSRSSLDDYSTLDLTLRKQHQDLTLSVSVRNLLDADVREPSPIPVYVNNDFPMAGRSIYGEAAYRF
jgi:iron complex outermembrane receptor protein